jgi:hypothetical protein
LIALLRKAAGEGLSESENRNGLEPNATQMSCRIERLASGEDSVVLRVSGRIHAEHVGTLRELLGREKGGVAIDLKEVNLVDREAVRLLALSEANGTELRNCPAYIREWVARERTHTGAELSDLKTGERDDIEDL